MFLFVKMDSNFTSYIFRFTVNMLSNIVKTLGITATKNFTFSKIILHKSHLLLHLKQQLRKCIII